MNRLLRVWIAVLLVSSAHSGVNLKNGNFYISYTDIVLPGQKKPLEITRTYNSKSTQVGWFGFGWGNDFETTLRVGADGSVVVHENGSGALTRFTPKSQIDGKKAAQKIVGEIRKKTSMSDANAKKLIKLLANDAELRHLRGKQLGLERKISTGTKLYSNTSGLQTLIKVEKGFIRKSGDQKQEFFNQYGKCFKIEYKSGLVIHFVPMDRKHDKELKSIRDSFGKQIFFSWYSDGRVKKIYSSEDRKATYSYKGKNLVSSTDLAGNLYKYDYNSNHNLTLIRYEDKTTTQIAYHNKTQFVSSVKKQNNETISYKYDHNPKNPDFHYWTEVTKLGLGGKQVSNRYEYEIRVKPDGQRYTYRIMTRVNGLETETTYSQSFGLPTKIVRGKEVTSFEYNKDGLLTKKRYASGEKISLAYNKTCGKVSEVVDKKGWTKFNYDKKCNLIKSTNAKGRSILLIYNHKSQITRMVDRNVKTKKQQVLTFTYNGGGRPVEIGMDKVGKISIEYDGNGQIKKVSSKQGYKMTLNVSKAFQNLLAIVKPAGVNLSAR